MTYDEMVTERAIELVKAVHSDLPISSVGIAIVLDAYKPLATCSLKFEAEAFRACFQTFAVAHIPDSECEDYLKENGIIP